MGIMEFRATATKVTVRDGDVIMTSAVDTGGTVRIVYGLAPLAVLITTLQKELKEGE
jgi:predicted N-acetyltransferase YhbS